MIIVAGGGGGGIIELFYAIRWGIISVWCHHQMVFVSICGGTMVGDDILIWDILGLSLWILNDAGTIR